MSRPTSQGWRRRHRRSAWVIGLLVLAALGVSIYSLIRSESGRTLASRLKPASVPEVPQQVAAAAVPKAGAKPQVRGRPIRGVVRLPNGKPAGSATVSIYRALTAWPEWRRELLEQAITNADGVYLFRFETTHGLLVGFEHPSHAGGLEEVSPLREQELRLLPGFSLDGYVRSAWGPVPNARVVLESVLSDVRRAEECTTGVDGSYSFTNLPAGPMRLVARHDSWQPRTVPAVVIGDLRHVDLQFERPAHAPLRGRVISAVSLLPIEGAVVELLAGNHRPGLVLPMRTRTGPDGSFVLAGLPRGNMQLLVRHEAHGADMNPLVIGAVNAEVQIELPSRSEVSGRLSGGSPPEFRGGELLQIRDLAGQLGYCVVGSDGRFRFAEPLSPGPATITVLGRGFSFERSNTPETAARITEAARTELDLHVKAPTLVRGNVVDEAGKPLAGAAVILTRVLAENARSISDAAFQFDLGAVGSQVVQLFGQDRDELLAVSGPDGGFEIRGHKPGPLQVRFELPGRGSRRVSTTVPESGDSKDLGAIELPRSCRVQGQVLRGSRSLAGALVTVVGRDCAGMTVTGFQGRFAVDDLLPGEYRVRASLPAQPKSSRDEMVTAAADRQDSVILRFNTGRTVRGSVTGSDGQPVVGAIVAVRGTMGQTTRTDAGGEFLLELADRAVELQVSLSDRSRSTVKSVPPGVDRVEVQLDTPPLCTLTAHVAGLPGKKRLAGALLRLTKLDGESEGETVTRWVDLQEGELRWPLCPAGSVRVVICSEGYAPFAIVRDFVANEEHALGDVLLEPGGRVQGVVQDQDGKPVAGATVLLGEEGDLDLCEPLVRTGQDGSFRISGVTSRSSRLVVRAQGFAARVIDLQLPQDVLGRAPLLVALERGSTIEVTCASAPDGGIVQLRRDGRLLASSELDENGRAWFTNRSAGTYTVQLLGSQTAPESVDVGTAPTASVRLP